MKKSILFIMMMAAGMSSCQDNNEQPEFDYVNEKLEEMVGLIEQSSNVDDALLMETLLNYTIVPSYSFIETEEGWRDNNAPDSSYCAGVVFYDLGIFTYCCVGSEAKLTKYGEYSYSYDDKNNTLYTKSIIHDFTYSCTVRYFDGKNLILDGLFAPTDDIYDDNYAKRRIITEFVVDKEIRKSLEDGTFKFE